LLSPKVVFSELVDPIKRALRINSPFYVPDEIHQLPSIPTTLSGEVGTTGEEDRAAPTRLVASRGA
jgi:hypothetical protein